MGLLDQQAAPLLLGAVVLSCHVGIAALFHASWRLGLATSFAGMTALIVFVLIRHHQLQAIRTANPVRLKQAAANKDLAHTLQGAYVLIVLGSGGHTKEMLTMIGVNLPKNKDVHRRYLISSGDGMSLNHLEAFEKEIEDSSGTSSAGTYDFHIVTRARKIHQSLLTTPFTALQSVLEIFPLLMRSPFSGHRKRQQFPDIVFTNGPATGFIVGLVAYVLKLFFLAPDDAMQILFVESWARIKTLSLTGKLFYFTSIADVFLVQHKPVADRYQLPNAGCMVVQS